LSINIVNTNHLHLSGYTNQGKPRVQSSNTIENEKKDDFQSIIHKFKPEKVKTKQVKIRGTPIEKHKIKKLKQEIKTTRPKKNILHASGKFLFLII